MSYALRKVIFPGVELAVLPQRFLSQRKPRAISLSLHCLKSAFLVVSLLQDAFWIASCAMPQGL
jgi:hypothetical protein